MHFSYILDGYREHFTKHPIKEGVMPNGTRVFDKEPHELRPGEYGKWAADDHFYGMPPGTDLLANLASHTIDQHEDGTITVTPSILVSDNKTSWHGYLTRGEWKPC